MEFQETIKAIRKSTNLKQGDFASKVNVSKSFIAKIEIGLITPRPASLLKILAALKLNVQIIYDCLSSYCAISSVEDMHQLEKGLLKTTLFSDYIRSSVLKNNAQIINQLTTEQIYEITSSYVFEIAKHIEPQSICDLRLFLRYSYALRDAAFTCIGERDDIPNEYFRTPMLYGMVLYAKAQKEEVMKTFHVEKHSLVNLIELFLVESSKVRNPKLVKALNYVLEGSINSAIKSLRDIE